MSEFDVGAVLALTVWAGWSFSLASARLKRVAEALETLVALAKRGRP